jgi:hypothetical protein
MKITKIIRYRNPDRVSRKVLLDTDTPKNRNKDIADRIDDTLNVLDMIEKKTDRLLTGVCNFIA